MRLYLIVVWFHWKLHTKKQRNYSGRSRVRRILLTCIQLLLLQFLHVIWSMPTNFALSKKPLNKIFYQLDNLKINCQKIYPASIHAVSLVFHYPAFQSSQIAHKNNITELKKKCSRLFKVQYSKPTSKKGNKNKIKGKERKLGQQEWKLTAKELLKPLHLSKSRMMLQSLLAHYLFIMKE